MCIRDRPDPEQQPPPPPPSLPFTWRDGNTLVWKVTRKNGQPQEQRYSKSILFFIYYLFGIGFLFFLVEVREPFIREYMKAATEQLRQMAGEPGKKTDLSWIKDALTDILVTMHQKSNRSTKGNLSLIFFICKFYPLLEEELKKGPCEYFIPFSEIS